MTWLLIAVILVACPVFIGLRLHSFSLPPLAPLTVTITADVSKFTAAMERLSERMTEFAWTGVTAQQAAENFAAAFRAMPSTADFRSPYLPDAFRWSPDMETP